jgi:DNA mismatch repair protein MutL
MGRIHLLSEEVASQVAAGEVVERPASVVKELVENSIDAGATRIEVLTRKGGSSAIMVVDNGCGMDRNDALLCLERHATSKIRSGHDLAAIHTLGFRGEALPSIASVSRFRLATRETDALAGTEVLVNGGKIEVVRDGGDAPGTHIEVRSLFYNLPARRKFLRSDTTEQSHVDHVMQLQAIGHPDLAFVLRAEDRTVFQLAPASSLLGRVQDLCGAALARELIAIDPEETQGLKIGGLIGKAGVSRATRQQTIVFLNGRPVENLSISQGLREGYHTALMKGQHPITFLFIEMDPAAVDVNVHPAKREVRFRDPSSVREAIVHAVRRALESDRGAWHAVFRSEPKATPQIAAERSPESSGTLSPPPPPPRQAELIAPRETFALRRDWASSPLSPPTASSSAPPPPEAPPVRAFPSPPNPPSRTAHPPPPGPMSATDFKILGVLGRLYVLMENPSGLVLVDQHAAHERILFEEMRRRMERECVPAQRLLLPVTLQVSPRDADWLERHLEMLRKAGVHLETFGPATYKLDAIPQFLRVDSPDQWLREVIDDLQQAASPTSRVRLGEETIAKTVCRHAVKANDLLREPELLRLLQDLMACELPYCCPHGRPTMIQIGYGELEKKFGRKV